VKKLVGRTDIEDALVRLDGLTQDEVRMAAAQGLKATHEVDDKVKTVEGKVQGVDDKVQGVDDRVRDVIDLIIDGMLFILNLLPHDTQFYPNYPTRQ
jgi:hypothetical protein